MNVLSQWSTPRTLGNNLFIMPGQLDRTARRNTRPWCTELSYWTLDKIILWLFNGRVILHNIRPIFDMTDTFPASSIQFRKDGHDIYNVLWHSDKKTSMSQFCRESHKVSIVNIGSPVTSSQWKPYNHESLTCNVTSLPTNMRREFVILRSNSVTWS